MRITPATPLVLGSASPRRREMLSMLGVPLVVRATNIDEALHAGERPDAYLERITRAKLDAVCAGEWGQESDGASPVPLPPMTGQNMTVLVADTIVVSPDGVILGKPTDDLEAQAMIERLAGATHEVSTRFVLSQAVTCAPPAHAQTVTTRVTFRAMARGEAREYALAGEGRDKAGAYALQGRAAAFVERIEGSYTAVVGLPLCEVVVALRALGWWG